jgi:hypothetical protein
MKMSQGRCLQYEHRTGCVSNMCMSHGSCLKHEHGAREMSQMSACRTHDFAHDILSTDIVGETSSARHLPRDPCAQDFGHTVCVRHRPRDPCARDIVHKTLLHVQVHRRRANLCNAKWANVCARACRIGRCLKHKQVAREMYQTRACRTDDISKMSTSHGRCLMHDHVAGEMSPI